LGGKVSFSVPDLPVGTHTLTVTYSGDSQDASSSATIQETVNMATPTVTLASSASPYPSARALALMATITPQFTSSGPSPIGPTGTVTFYDGSTVIGTASPTWFSGDMYRAVLGISTLSIGSHSITAVYSGDTNFHSATTAALAQTITNGATTTAL